MDDVEMKHWKDAGHVARRALEAIKSEIVEGASWHAVIESAERFIRRHGGKPAFPTTISVNELAAHYTTDHALTAPDGWETEMVFQKGDLVKLDIGVQIHGCIGDNALTVEVGNTGRHTEQIRASRESRDSRHRDHASWHPMAQGRRRGGATGHRCWIRADSQPLRAPTRALGAPCWGQRSCVRLREGPPGVRGTVQEDSVYAVEPFNTTGTQGLIENVEPNNSSNIYRVTGQTSWRKALQRKQLKPLGAQLARNLEERYNTLPFAERWAFPMLEKPFPEADEASRRSKWNALVKKLTSIRFLETYHALRCADGGMIGQFEHTVHVAPGGAEVLTVE